MSNVIDMETYRYREYRESVNRRLKEAYKTPCTIAGFNNFRAMDLAQARAWDKEEGGGDKHEKDLKRGWGL